MDVSKLRTGFDSFLQNKIAPLDIKQKIGILGGAILVPAAVFGFFFVSPKYDQIKSLTTQLEGLQKELETVIATSKQLDKVKEELAATEKQFKEASLLLPQQKEIPSLLTNISGLGTKVGLDFISFSPGGEVQKDFYAEIPVNIAVNGPYHDIGLFLYEVSKLPRIVSVSNISMGGPVRKDKEMVLNSNFSLITYRFIGTTSGQSQQAEKK